MRTRVAARVSADPRYKCVPAVAVPWLGCHVVTRIVTHNRGHKWVTTVASLIVSLYKVWYITLTETYFPSHIPWCSPVDPVRLWLGTSIVTSSFMDYWYALTESGQVTTIAMCTYMNAVCHNGQTFLWHNLNTFINHSQVDGYTVGKGCADEDWHAMTS